MDSWVNEQVQNRRRKHEEVTVIMKVMSNGAGSTFNRYS